MLTKALLRKVPVKRRGKTVYLSRLETGIEHKINEFGMGDFQTFKLIMSLGPQIGEQLRENNYKDGKGGLSDAKRHLAIILGIDPDRLES